MERKLIDIGWDLDTLRIIKAHLEKIQIEDQKTNKALILVIERIAEIDIKTKEWRGEL